MTAVDLEFVDANILVYAHDAHPAVRPERERARQLLDRLWETGTGRLSTQVLPEFYVTVTRKLRLPLRNAEAYEIVSQYSLWPVHSPTAADVLAAIRLHHESQLSYWDALILVSAGRAHCKRLWSQDLKAGQTIQGVEVRNPLV
ncbi:MAG: PIN domain-containing protein [Clostridia bacterium]